MQTWILADIFLKNEQMNKMSSSLQGKQLAVFGVNDKIQAFKQKLEFGKTCIHHHEADSFPRLF